MGRLPEPSLTQLRHCSGFKILITLPLQFNIPFDSQEVLRTAWGG